MTPAVVLAILVAAGAALVVQNLIMVRITGVASTVLVTLVLNSSIGLVLLVGLLWWRNGAGFMAETAGLFRWWMILPGVLGSFFVFAGIMGYQRLGAAATVSVLVASQLVLGLLVDQARSGAALREAMVPALGAVLLVLGAWLVARRGF